MSYFISMICFQVTFVTSLIREHFTEVCMNQQIGLGRDFVRQVGSCL